MGFEIYAVRFGAGQVGLAPAPGQGGSFARDLQIIADWAPTLVISMTEADELVALGAGRLAESLAAEGIGWRHFPVQDFGIPKPDQAVVWSDVSAQARQIMARGGRVLVHCRGGCGRSGMVLLRLMIEAGEEVETALARLREVRPCAVETKAQMAWAARTGT